MLPQILASDFDGVICNGLIEYFASTEKAYQKIWQQEKLTNSDNFAEDFYRLRPVIETGWEMPVLLRALVLKYQPDRILNNWRDIRDKIVEQEQLDKKRCSQALDTARDNWIKNDLAGWLKLHRFYPGVLDRLKQVIDSNVQFYIVTTKEGRFVKQLLKQQGIELNETQIIGKESQRPKYETLRIIRDRAPESNPNIWFIEDRLQALKQVQQQPDLQDVKLFLADWGYNTEPDKNFAKSDSDLNLISLDKFSRDFSLWLQ